MRQLKQVYPNVRIGVLVTERNRDVYQSAKVADELIPFTLVSCWKQRKRWDLYIDFTTRFNSRAIVFDKILSPQRVMIFEKSPKKYYTLDNVHNYDFYYPIPPNIHFKDYLKYTPIAQCLENKPTIFYQLNLTDKQKQDAEFYWEKNKLRILFCPLGSHWKRRIPENEYDQLLAKIDQQFLSKIDIKLGYSKFNERYLTNCHMDQRTFPIQPTERTTVAQYLALVNSADIVFAVDSGTVHVACAFEKPLLAFYANCPANIARWYPYSKQSEKVKILISQGEETSSDMTQNFALEEAVNWLNQAIVEKLEG